VAVRSVALLHDGFFELDLGMLVYLKTAYYGQKYMAALRPMLVRTEKEVLVVDTGLCDPPERIARFYKIERPTRIVPELAKHGVRPEDVDLVVNTHLHLDHAGNDKLFPNAMVVVQKLEWAFASDPPRYARGGYLPELLEGLDVETVQGEHVVTEGVRVVPTPGHTPGHQSVVVEVADGRKLVYCGDAAPLAENYRDRNVVGILTDAEAALRSLDALRALGGTPVFDHDRGQGEL